MFNLESFWRRLRGDPHSLTLCSVFSSLPLSSVTHLVWVDGHAGGEPHHRDAVEACSVGDRRWSEVVIGLGRVTHQDSIDLQRCSGRTFCHPGSGRKKMVTPLTFCVFVKAILYCVWGAKTCIHLYLSPAKMQLETTQLQHFIRKWSVGNIIILIINNLVVL